MAKAMCRFKRNDISWLLENNRWSDIVETVKLPQDERRPHLILPHPDGPLFVKFFRENGVIPFLRNLFFPRGQKEYVTAKRLLALSLPTPQPVGYGTGRTFSCSVQLWIDGRDFFTMMRTRELRQNSLIEVASLLRKMTAAKVRHDDFHGGNILFGPDGPCIVDLHKVRIKSAFRPEDEVSNVCHVLNGHYNHLAEEEKIAFFNTYGKPEIRDSVEKELEIFAARWIERKKKRAFRTTSKLLSTGNVVFIKGREMLATGERISVIKEDRKAVVVRHSDHVRKVYTHSRRLRRAWKNHIVLEYMEIPAVPKPFYVRKPSAKQKGFIAMEDLAADGEELDTFLDRTYDHLDYNSRMRLLKSFSHFCTSLLQAHVGHRDMKACNFFIVHDGSFRLLDVEDICFERGDRASILRMCLQLNMSIPRRISIADRMKFFSLITQGSRLNKKELLRTIAAESLKGRIQYVGLRGTVIEQWGDQAT